MADDDLLFQPPRPSEEVVDALIERFVEGLRRSWDANEMQKRAAEIAAAADRLIENCYAAADAFGFDLLEETKAKLAAQQGPKPEAEPAALRLLNGRPTVREFILAEAEAAFPNTVRAATLRQAYLDRFGAAVHEKTFGMTLYRTALKTGAIRRAGRADWVFVPLDERATAPRDIEESENEASL